MSLHRRAQRRDEIEPRCHSIALKHGWKGMKMSKIDAVYWRGLEVLLVEYKTGNAGLTEFQKALLVDKCPLIIIRSVEDAEAVFE